MSENTSISWTQSTWNPIRARVKKDAVTIAHQKGYASLYQIMTGVKSTGVPRVIPGETWGYHCELVSDGCGNCYACTLNGRTLPAWGTGLPYDRRSRDLVDIYVDDEELLKPLKWRRGRKIFVCSMTDLFAEFVSDEQIDRMFAVMALCPQHTFQVLTKRPERMRVYFSKFPYGGNELLRERLSGQWQSIPSAPADAWFRMGQWPLPNVWLGVSVEDQKTADARIPLLLQTPAAVRFVSYEPALGPVDFRELPSISGIGRYLDSFIDSPGSDAPFKLNWIIVGGESGPGARPFDIAWAWNTVEECREAGVACFVKQLGAKPVHDHGNMSFGGGLSWIKLKDRKGSDPLEWPEDLRVQQFPESRP